MRIEGYWHQAGSAARVPARLVLRDTANNDEPVQIQRQDRRTAGTSRTLAIEASDGSALMQTDGPVSISDRLGNVERTITFADDSIFTTRDNAAVDLAFSGRGESGQWVHRLESSKRWIVLALIGTVLAVLAFFFRGIPWASERIAHALPQSASEAISGSTLDFLDDWLLEETKLDQATQSRIEAHFRSTLLPLDDRNDGIRYQLHFRDWTMGGEGVANALALPSGDIVLTDAFVNLCETQDEMDSVILHEIGHVVERHSLQRVVEASFVGTTVMLVTGDGSGFADMGVGLGSLLVSSHYSRGHEAAADRYAFDHMLKAGIDPAVFGDIMARMAASHVSHDEPDAVPDANPDSDSESGGDDDRRDELKRRGFTDFLASHPNTDDRIEQANRYSACFARGQTVCPAD